MNTTKENILLTALHLFSADGYEAVSVSDIAGQLGMTKGALYKHYKNKRAIFESILQRMEELDAVHAKEYELPEGTIDEMADAYGNASVNQIIDFSIAQFNYWTREDFPSCFRKMLTIEQFRNEEMRTLYQQYLVSGPLGYITDLFSSLGIDNPYGKAVEFYSPMFLFYSLYDGGADSESITSAFEKHLRSITLHPQN